jgi:UDP-glucose 4-epimerase
LITPPVSLVTGCSGFIGSHVVRELLAMGHRVVGIDDLSGGFVENHPPGLEFRRGSIEDPALIAAVFAETRVDYVFHLAAYAAEGLSHFVRRFNYTNNLIGSINLINAAVSSETVRCFVFTSSIAVYGRNQLPMTEELEPRPEDPYGIAKYAVELDLRAAGAMWSLPSIVFRPHNVYGENQNLGDGHRNVVGIFMNQVMRGMPMTIFGDGLQTRAFTYIDDVAPIIARSIERPAAFGSTFNLGSDTPRTVLDIARAVAAAFDKPLRLEHLEERHEVKDAFSSHHRARAVFGDLVRDVPLEQGIARMARWAKEVGPREPKYFGAVEIEKGLPASWVRRG